MVSREYTAQEMRETAEGLVDSCVADIISILVGHGNLKAVKGAQIVAMLRQAADMRERCELLMLNMIPHRHDKEIVKYIIRGDAGKEEK